MKITTYGLRKILYILLYTIFVPVAVLNGLTQALITYVDALLT